MRSDKPLPDSVLREFILESNKIEGIYHVRDCEVDVHKRVLAKPQLDVSLMCQAVAIIQPHSVLRCEIGRDVRVGEHLPPRGGPQITHLLHAVLEAANELDVHPYAIHQDYETLHPFTDGNGRSGRLVWLWMMLNRGEYVPEYGFLHQWYYQSLDQSVRNCCG